MVAYLTLYSFTAFMFWLQAMAVDTWLRFRSLGAMLQESADWAEFCHYTVYAQGCPGLLCLLVAGLDNFAPESGIILPGMGLAQCFLGGHQPGSIALRGIFHRRALCAKVEHSINAHYLQIWNNNFLTSFF